MQARKVKYKIDFLIEQNNTGLVIDSMEIDREDIPLKVMDANSRYLIENKVYQVSQTLDHYSTCEPSTQTITFCVWLEPFE